MKQKGFDNDKFPIPPCLPQKTPYLCRTIQRYENSNEPPARVAQLVERDLAKVEVASSNLVSRSKV